MNGLARTSGLAVLALLAAVSALDGATPVPKVTGPIPVTALSHPQMAADREQTIVDLKKLGYVEEEYFISGSANVYDWAADGSISVKTADAPYTTRILVRRPADAKRFSGNVVIEPVNNARSYDWAFLWPLSYDYFAERGDVFVGLTHLPSAIAALKKFNATRYAPLSMANPTPNQPCAGGGGRGGRGGASDSEEGLRWDMISQVGALFKSNALPKELAPFKAQYVYGTSHYAELSTYVNAIHNHSTLDNGKPVYDGYLVKSNDATDAAFANLDQWVRKGTPPPRADRAALKDGAFVIDANGNGIGGVRSPYLDVPVATYFPKSAGQQTCQNLARKQNFDAARLNSLYPTIRSYTDKVADDVDALVKAHWLTEADGKKLKSELNALPK